MSPRRKGKILRWIKEHSLPPHYYGHVCHECRYFHESYPYGVDNKPTENYCCKWLKVVSPQKHACEYFTFKYPLKKPYKKNSGIIVIRLSASGYKATKTFKRVFDACEKIGEIAKKSGCKFSSIRLKTSVKKVSDGKILYTYRREVIITHLNESIVAKITRENVLKKIIPNGVQVEIEAKLT
jgi:hypothetical protein